MVDRSLNPDRKLILHLCADTGSDTMPFANDPNFEVRLIGKEIGVQNYSPPPYVYGIIANPVCTEFSRFHGFNKRTGDHEVGMFLVNECMRIIKQANPKFWVIENPATGALKKYFGKPAYEYEPWWYGSPWTKRTALWGHFNIPERKFNDWNDVPKIEGLYARPGRSKPSLAFMHKSHKSLIREFDGLPEPEDDAEFRSTCSQQFAQAFYEANR